MANQVLPITGLDTIGLIEDVPPVSLPPAAFSDCRNVRFRDGAVQKMEGDVNIMPYIKMADEDILRYVAWWPNPNLAFASLGYYLVIVQQVNADSLIVDNAYLLKVDELGRYSDPSDPDLRVELTTDSDSFKGEFLPAGNWQHTFFQGGFSLIINNGLQAPRFILDSEDNTEVVNVPDFAELPNWASYADDPLYQELIAMEDDESIDPATLQVTAGVVRDFGDFLVAGNLVERANVIKNGDVVRTNAVIRALPGIVRSSDIAMAGQIPANWNPFATAVNTADEFTITNDGVVQDFVELQGNMFIYSNSSISVMSRTGNATVPLSVRPVTTSYGTLTTDAVLEFDGKHFVVGAQDIYLFTGHPGNIQSVGDGRVRDAFYNRLNPLSIDNVFLLPYQQKDEIWICFPNKDSLSGLVNEALIWNYRKNNWTKRDLQNVVAGDIAPVPGGGLPLAELIFTGSSGNNNVVGDGVVHVNTLSSEQDIVLKSDGITHQYQIRLSQNLPQIAETTIGTPIHFIQFGPDFNSGESSDTLIPLNFTAQGRTFDEGGGRFLQVPNYDSSGDPDGTFRDFNFRVGLSPNIQAGPDTTTNSEQFGEEVTLRVMLDLLRNDPENFTWPRLQDAIDGDPTIPTYIHEFFLAANTEEAIPTYDENAPITLHLTDEPDTFVLQYEFIPGEVLPYQSFVSFGVSTESFDEDQLIRTATEAAYDVLGDLIVEEEETKNFGTDPITGDPVSGTANTFYFDFEELIDNMLGGGDKLEDLVFFFKGAADPNAPTGYADLPTNAVVFNPDPIQGVDAGIGMDGGEVDEGSTVDGGTVGGTVEDGERRIDVQFMMNLVQDEPLSGTELLSRLQYSEGMIEENELPLQVWVPGTTGVTEFTLVAYQKPLDTNGEIGSTTTDQSSHANIVVDDIDDRVLTEVPPIVRFSGVQQEFLNDIDNCGWRATDQVTNKFSETAFSFTIAFGYDSDLVDGDGNKAIPTDGGPPVFDQDGNAVTLDDYLAAQRQAFAEAMFNAFFNNVDVPLRAVDGGLKEDDDGNWTIDLESPRRIAVELNISIDNADQTIDGSLITVSEPNYVAVYPNIATSSTPGAGHIDVRQVRQGKYDYYFAENDPDAELDDHERLVFPRIRIQHIDPEIRFFDFDISFDLVPEDPTATTYSSENWMNRIQAEIDAVMRLPQWGMMNPDYDPDDPDSPQYIPAEYDTTTGSISLSTIPVIYDASIVDEEGNPIDTGVEVPDANPANPFVFNYVSFPGQREAASFIITFCPGSGWADEIGTDLTVPTQTTVEGSYPTNNTPSYIALRTTDSSATTVPELNPEGVGEEVILFAIPDNLDADGVVQNLQLQIERRAPRLRAVISGSGRLSVQPANYNDLAEFVVEFIINNTASIDRMRELLDDRFFNQDEFNPKPTGNLPERVQIGRDENQQEVDNDRGFINPAEGSILSINNDAPPTEEFDVLRPWPKTQVNFTLEFPIFAATRPWPDGATTNKVIGSDIGYARPAFERPEVRRIEEIDGTRVVIREGQDFESDYESFVEREQQGLSPEFNTETLNSVAMWTDGKTQEFYRGPDRYNKLELRVDTTDNPGQSVDLSTTAKLKNIQYISEDYKTDVRVTGRFVNWRVTDETTIDDTDTSPNTDKTFNQQTEWRLSGLQFEVGPAGRR